MPSEHKALAERNRSARALCGMLVAAQAADAYNRKNNENQRIAVFEQILKAHITHLAY